MKPLKVFTIVLLIIGFTIFEAWYDWNFMLSFLIKFSDKHGPIGDHFIGLLTFIFRVAIYVFIFVVVTTFLEKKYKNLWR